MDAFGFSNVYRNREHGGIMRLIIHTQSGRVVMVPWDELVGKPKFVALLIIARNIAGVGVGTAIEGN